MIIVDNVLMSILSKVTGNDMSDYHEDVTRDEAIIAMKVAIKKVFWPLIMVVLTLSVLLFTGTRASSQDKWFGHDKQAHLIVSFAGSYVVSEGFRQVFPKMKNPELVGCVTMLVIGGCKEIADPYMGGQRSWRDMGANFTGCGAAYVSQRLITKWYRKRGWI